MPPGPDAPARPTTGRERVLSHAPAHGGARDGVQGRGAHPPSTPGQVRSTAEKCGASTRRGTPCRCKPEPGKARCRLHGGKSTGPTSPEGRERIAEFQRRRWEAHRAKKAKSI
nr:HGGxSTG domain-containing protein [Paroceanicella profunda]